MARILIVEDNPVNMELFSDLLDARGHEVLQASTAEEGIQSAKRLFPAIILMDIALPGMDGLTATWQLKQNASTASIPIVALTAHAMHGDAEKAKTAGCAGYITKPINTREFAQTVEQYIGEKR